MVPGTARQVVVAVQVAVGENVQAGAFLVADDGGQGILILLAETDVEHAGVQGRPHMLASNQRGRGQEPVTVQGRMVLAVTVNMHLRNPCRGSWQGVGEQEPEVNGAPSRPVRPQ